MTRTPPLRRLVTTAALAAVTVATLATPAHADKVLFDCNTAGGAVVGTVVHPAGGPVSIRCYIRVNGVEVWTTWTGAGEALAYTSGQHPYSSPYELCSEVWTTHGQTGVCNWY